jgi:hypothetical protein
LKNLIQKEERLEMVQLASALVVGFALVIPANAATT